MAPEPADECRLQAAPTPAADTLTVVLPDSVDLAHAPFPVNDSERFVFRELFETLIHIDCLGNVRPGLARSWTRDDSGRTWIFTLRDEDRPAGTESTAEAVASSWRAHPAALEGTAIETATPLDDGRLKVTLRTPEDSVPRILADPLLGVAPNPSLGLGPARRFLLVSPSAPAPPAEFQVVPGSDPRDALDRGADLLVTRDPAVTGYASSRPDLVVVPLPWSRTYVLLQPPDAEPIRAPVTDDSVRRSLARDAVRADARPAEPPFWWERLASCPVRPAAGRAQPAPSRVVYPAGDAAARGLAERIVALAAGGAPLRAIAVGSAELASSLRAGSERGYVLPAPRRTFAPCREASDWPAGARILALIDTRASAIVRRGSPVLGIDWDGTLRLSGQRLSQGPPR